MKLTINGGFSPMKKEDIEVKTFEARLGDLQKRVEHLETEVELLKELVKTQNKILERDVIICPSTPIQLYDTKEPTLRPPYRFTCKGGKE